MRDYRVGLHMHVLETPYQQEYAQRFVPGRRPVRHLATWDCSARSSPSAMGLWLPKRTWTSSPAPHHGLP